MLKQSGTPRTAPGASQERRDAYRRVSKTSITYGMQSGQLKEVRAFDPERQGRWSLSSQQATLRRLDKAFTAFFRRIKAGEKPGHPRFRGNPRYGRRAAVELAETHRALQTFPRKKKEHRTAAHRRAVEKVAALHRKARRQRTDHAHKTALALVRAYDVIAHERLRITNMVRAPKSRPEHGQPGSFLPNGAAARAGLNKSIHAAGWEGCSWASSRTRPKAPVVY